MSTSVRRAARSGKASTRGPDTVRLLSPLCELAGCWPGEEGLVDVPILGRLCAGCVAYVKLAFRTAAKIDLALAEEPDVSDARRQAIVDAAVDGSIDDAAGAEL